MPEILVCCAGHPGPARAGQPVIELDVAPDATPERRLKLELGWISEALADDIPPVVADLLDIATYVYFADRMSKRESDTMGRMGAGWRRRFRFLVRVRKPQIWSKPEVARALCEALGFLSDDSFSFAFESLSNDLGLDPYLGINQPEVGKFVPDEVMLFSGGLDSLAGAVQLLDKGRKVALVAHQSSTFVARRQNDLAASLSIRFPGRVFSAPVRIVKGEQTTVEHTQRLRSFLFVALGVVMARMYGRARMLMFENGITSFNLPVAEHVVGTRSSRTTHPQTLARFERLLRLLGLKEFQIENPFVWRTKAEVVSDLTEFDDLIPVTTSCARVRDLPMTNRQCGICSQCVERRIALLSAGLGQSEPPDAYAVDLFTGAHQSPRDPLMAGLIVLQATHLAEMTNARFAESYGQCFRALTASTGGSRERLARIHELHQRYGSQVVAVVDQELKAHASIAAILKLSATSLLPRLTSSGWFASTANLTPIEPPASEQAKGSPPAIARRIAFYLDRNGAVRFDGGVSIGGNTFTLFKALFDRFQKDLESGIPKDQFGYVKTRQLVAELGWAPEQLRQQVLRSRKMLAERFLERVGYDLDSEDIIQSWKWSGYRLNPYLLLVDELQIANEGPPSRHIKPSVTTQATPPPKLRIVGL